MNGAGPFVHDPLDSVGAAAALGAASEAGIDLAHAGPSRLFCDYCPHLVVAEHIGDDRCWFKLAAQLWAFMVSEKRLILIL